jgi:hypothetical protein
VNPTRGANALPLTPILDPNAAPSLISKINWPPDDPPPVLAKINMGDPQFAGSAPAPFPQLQKLGAQAAPALKPIAMPPGARTPPPVVNKLNPQLLAQVNQNDPQFASSLPALPVPPLQKIGTAQQQTSPLQQNITADQGRLQKLRWNDANPYGTAENHPGVAGKLLHVLSVAGNIAGDIFAPTVMANVPGTDMNRQLQEGGLIHQLNSEQEEQSQNDQRDAATAQTQATTAGMPQEQADRHALVGPEVRHLNDESDGLEHPQVSLANAYAHAVNDAIAKGLNPKDDPIVQQLGDAMRSIQPGQNKAPEAPRTIPIQKGGQSHQMAYDPKTGMYDLDQGVSGEKPPTVNLNDGRKEELALRNGVLKTYQPALASAERFDVMAQNYTDAVNHHDQQAMLSLLANHLGMTMGLQKGARMTKDIIQEAEHSQPWLAGLKAKFSPDGYLSGVTLSPGQMRQMVDLGRNRFAEDIVSARSQARYEGAKDDGPDRIPSPATITFYIGQAHGDVAKAKQLATHDGWTVN